MERSRTYISWNRLLFIGLCSVALVAAGLFVYQGVLNKPSTDHSKRQEVEKMAAEIKMKFPDIAVMDARKAMELMDDNNIVFIDVRRPEEQALSMLPGAITDTTFLDNPRKYEEYTKIGYCTIGYRSSMFAQKLKNAGISIYNLKGGLLGWVHDGGKVYNDKGQSFKIHVYGSPWKLGPEGYEEVW
jgi:sodium/bile acid cotransporter 7